MPIYDRPTKALMSDWARENLRAGQVFDKAVPVKWFSQKYPKIKSNTVALHVEGMAINSRARRHHPNIKPGSGHDLFYKVGPSEYRLWDAATDPQPLYKDEIDRLPLDEMADVGVGERRRAFLRHPPA